MKNLPGNCFSGHENWNAVKIGGKNQIFVPLSPRHPKTLCIVFLRRLLFFRKYAYLCPRNGQGNAVRIGDSTRCCESKKPCDNRLLSFSEICATGTRKLLRHFRGLCKSAAFRGFSLRDHRCGHYCLREHYCLRFFSPLLLS